MKVYEQHCSVYKCGHIYKATSIFTPCDKCGISENDILDAGTNDRESIYRMWNERSNVNSKKENE